MQNIVQQFVINNEVGKIHTVKTGHINDSFIVDSKYSGGESYFLQKINHHIFTDIAGLQQNIQIVTNHLQAKLAKNDERFIDRKVLQLIPTNEGKLYFEDDNGNFWRLYKNIQNAHSYDVITPKLAYKAGKAFGSFQCLLSDIPHDELIETIPNFHNMEFRLKQFREAVNQNTANRLDEVKELVAEIEKRAHGMCQYQDLYRTGKLPKRINHCDTKVNNILFDDSDNVLCVVDLDTVMPGFVLSDFGDFMRSAGNNGKEDEKDLSKVSFNMEIFKSYTNGYFKSAKGFLTQLEIGLLPYGAKLMTYMQLTRFLTDYLNGDTYYKINFPNHNLDRSKAQFKLLQSIEDYYTEMQAYIISINLQKVL